jgi:Arc/MetJ family transcription regulator
MRRRTNIEIEERYVRTIMRRYKLRTMREAVDLALRALAGQSMTRSEALEMRGARAIDDLPTDRPPAGAS